MDLTVVKMNEAVFRNILRDLKTNRHQRPCGDLIPVDLETEAPIDEILQRYVDDEHCYGKFTFTSFEIVGDVAIVGFQDVATLSGGGACLEYTISGETVTYARPACVMRS